MANPSAHENPIETPRPHRSDREFAAMVHRVERSHEELDHFVRALSHDMSANFMLLEDSFSRLKRSIDDPAQPDRQDLVAHVEACLRESKRFLNDLVGLAQTGRVVMEPSSVDAGTVLDEVLFEQRDLLRSRGVEVRVRRPLPPVWCNPHRLKQVLTNLIRNATLHGGDPQQPRITISEETAGPDNHKLVALRVHDNGRGIDPRFREEVFLPGRRLAEAAAQGSGMGLAIVRKIIEHYGGEVYVDPRCVHGTAIVFRLPAPKEQAASLIPDRGAERPTEQDHRNVEPDAPHERRDLHSHQPLQQATRPWPRP